MSEQLIHIIPLDNNICHPVKIGNNVINLKDLKNFEYLLDSNFERTTVSINNTNIIDLNVRSSWTNILDFWIHCPVEAKKFFDENYVYYEKNGFDLKCIVSTVDGNKYCVRERSKVKKAADMLAKVSQKCKDLVNYVHQKYPDKENVKRLKDGFNPQKISEIF